MKGSTPRVAMVVTFHVLLPCNSAERTRQLDVSVETFPFPDIRQNNEGSSSAVNAAGNVKLNATASRQIGR